MICLGRFFRPEKSPEHVFVSTPVRNEKHGRCIGGDVMSAIEKPKRKGLPSDEIVWETYRKDGNDKYVVTSKKIRDFYFIYEVSPTGYN